MRRLEHIRIEIDKAADIVARGREAFDADFVLSYAGTKLVENIGEAASAIQIAYGMEGNDMPAPLDGLDVPWSAIKGMRNLTSHQYWLVDHDTVWGALKDDIPHIAGQLDGISIGTDPDVAAAVGMPATPAGVCGSVNTDTGQPCQNPRGCSIPSH